MLYAFSNMSTVGPELDIDIQYNNGLGFDRSVLVAWIQFIFKCIPNLMILVFILSYLLIQILISCQIGSYMK